MYVLKILRKKKTNLTIKGTKLNFSLIILFVIINNNIERENKNIINDRVEKHERERERESWSSCSLVLSYMNSSYL